MNNKKFTSFSNKPVELNENSLIMAIESSCDETACAIVQGGRKVPQSLFLAEVHLHSALQPAYVARPDKAPEKRAEAVYRGYRRACGKLPKGA